MNHSVTIRCYQDATDRFAVIRLWKEVFGYTEPRNRPELAIDLKIRENDALFFVALSEDKVAGTVMAGYDGHRGWIYSLAVEPSFRRMGAGSALLKHAETELIRRGCPKINLQITASNAAVTEFYRKNGYRIEERISMGKTILDD
jgi:hypothetical protein